MRRFSAIDRLLDAGAFDIRRTDTSDAIVWSFGKRRAAWGVGDVIRKLGRRNMRTIFFEAMGTMLIGLVLSASMASAAGDPMKGAKAYRACKACHTLEPGRHMTSPSLAGIWNRKAGTIEGFTRSSPALKSANIIWDAKTLDHWLASPGTLVPGNWMTFSGIKDPQARADLIAYLKSVTAQRPEGKTAKNKITSRGPSASHHLIRVVYGSLVELVVYR
jgi:cytochrome c2